MTRKDYIEVARAIKETLEECSHSEDAKHTIENMTGRLAAIFAADNASFDPKKFFTACGLYKGK